MGIRMDQFMGITGEARKFLEENAVRSVVNICNHCHRADMEIIGKKYSATHGMYDNEYDLNTYDLLNGDTAIEVLQCSPWSSGPVIFLMLEVYGKRNGEVNTPKQVFKWSEEDIERSM